MKVTAGVLNVRSAPGTGFAVMDQLKRGDTVTVLEGEGDWVRIAPCGWVSKTFLAPSSPRIAPDGLSGIIRTFGLAGGPAASAGRVQLPAPLVVGGSVASITRVACHIEMVQVFTQVFGELHSRSLWHLIKSYDGIYNNRTKSSSSTKKSTHAWGIAIDLNASTNRLGTKGDMDSRIVTIFEEHGFLWGGRWAGRSMDPMHFQFATNY
jgi:hypothetical protein